MMAENNLQKVLEILVVDDDLSVLKTNERLVGLLLKGKNYNVETAHDGSEALDKVVSKKGGYDLIITDVRMPKKSGIEFYQELKAIYPEQQQRVVFVTGTPEDLRGKLEGASHEGALPQILTKPFHIVELQEVISKYIK